MDVSWRLATDWRGSKTKNGWQRLPGQTKAAVEMLREKWMKPGRR
jgi:hypothetical protein